MIDSKHLPVRTLLLCTVGMLCMILLVIVASASFVSETKIVVYALIGPAILIIIGTGIAAVRVARRLDKDNAHLQAEIEERKQVEEKLRWKTAFLDAQVNSSMDGILVVDEHGKRILQNQRFGNLLKIPREIVEDSDDGKQHRWVTETTKNPEQFAEKVGYLNAHREEISYDEIELKDGMILDLYSSPVIGEDGRYFGRIWSFRDVTERKQMEIALRETEEKFRQLADNISDVFWMTSPDLRTIHYISPGYERIWGRSMESLYANPHQWVEAILPEERERVFRIFRALMERESQVSVEYQIARPDGTVRWIHDRGFQVRNAAGVLVRLTGIASDITERKHGEEIVQRLAAIVENSQEAIISKTLDGIIRSWNPAAERMFGYTAAEIIGRPLLTIIPRDRDEEESITLAGFLTGDAVRHLETVRVRKDGQGIDVSTTISPIKNPDGTITGASSIVRDITARKGAEAARDRLTAILEYTTDLVSITDPDGRLLYLNGAGRKLLGVGLEEEINETWISDFIPNPATHPILTEGIPTAARDGTWSGETLLLSRDGREFSISQVIVAHRSRDGRIEFFSTIMRDITAQKRVQQELVQSRETLRGILDHIPQRVFWKDHNSVYLGCNQSFAVEMGYGGPGEVIGKTDYDASWRELAEVYRADDRTFMAVGVTRRGFDEPGITADGWPRWLRTSKTPLHDQQGHVTGILGTFEDVTEYKLAKLEIERLNAELEQRVAQRTEELFAATQEAEDASRAKSEFLSRTSHELRTPLNAILGFGQLLEITGRDSEEADNIRQILSAGRHLLDLVNEVLDISGLEAGNVEIKVRSIEVSEVINEALAAVRALAAERDVTLGSLVCDSCVLADRQRFTQVILHLLFNAIKYNSRGGSVTLAAQETGGFLRLTISDTGPGIAAVDIAKIFTAFERLNMAGRVDGIGLGLTISKRLVEMMGGHIGVQSVPGEGSAFWIDLPVAPSLMAPAGHDSAPAKPVSESDPLSCKSVLYVQYGQESLRLITRIVARRPAIKLFPAGTWQTGLEIMSEHRPDLILIDPASPEGSGFHVLAEMRGDPRISGIPIVILTTETSAEGRAEADAAGADAVVAKPVDVRSLLTVLDRILGLEPKQPG